jgi:peptidyl-prolyl cis-trans isomerase SurA
METGMKSLNYPAALVLALLFQGIQAAPLSFDVDQERQPAADDSQPAQAPAQGLTLVPPGSAGPARGEPVTLNQIVAIVNDDIILQSELDQAIVEIIAQLQNKQTELPSRAVLEKQVLEKLVVERLQLQLAERSGVNIDDATLNKHMRELASENGVTLTQFREVLENEGYDYGKFRENLRQQLVISRLRQQLIGGRTKVSDQEVDNLLANLDVAQQSDVQYQLAHILIAVPEGASPDQIQAAQTRAEQLVTRLRTDADFTQTAVAESDGTTALEGGDIGWRNMGQMPTLFVEPLQDMQVGDISDPIRSPGGFHIIKLVEQRGDDRHLINQTHVRHILLKPDAIHSNTEVRTRIEQIEIRIRGGEDFASLARANSQDTLSAAKGGDLGWVSPGDLVPEFEEMMNSLDPGQVSYPFETQFGWHILEVLGRREHDSTEEYKRSRARQLIRSRKTDEQTFLWLRRLRDESYVEYRLDS